MQFPPIPSDLASYIGDPGMDSVRGQLLIDGAVAAVRIYTRQSLTLVGDDAAELRGVWGQVLKLPERPVVNVTAVSVDGIALSADEYNRVRDRLHRSNGWGGPRVVVVVTYSHGFAADAVNIQAAAGICLQVAARAAANPSTVQSEGIGDYSRSFGEGTAPGFALTANEQAMLDRYRMEYAS